MPSTPFLSHLALSYFDQAFESVLITTPQLEGDHPKILYANRAFCEMSGYTKEEVIGKTPRILQGPKTDRSVLDELKRSLLNDESFEGETFNYKKDGSLYRVHWNINPIRNEEGEIEAYISFQTDVTTTKTMAEHIRLLEMAIKQNGDHIALVDPQGYYIYVNESYAQRTGYAVDELLHSSPKILKSGRHNSEFYAELWKTLLEGNPFVGMFANRDKVGIIYHEKQTITPLFEEGSLIGFVVIGKNYEDEIALQQNLSAQSRRDPLTGLLNRLAFDETLQEKMCRYKSKGEMFSLLIADLDSFKQVNDTRGHDIGDQVLREVAQMLVLVLRKEDKIYRIGGDEFAFLLPGAEAETLPIIIRKIEEAFVTSKLNEKYGIGISAGGKVYSGEEEKEFIHSVDERMYQSKYRKKS